VSGLEKPEAIASEWQGPWRPSTGQLVAATVCFEIMSACGNLFPWRLMADRWPWRNHRITTTATHVAMIYMAEFAPERPRC